MPFRPFFIALLLLAAGLVLPGAALTRAVAQAAAQAPSVSGPLQEVRIEGATSNQDLIRTLLVSRPGTRAEAINLEAERNLVYSLGYYAQVSVNLEDRGGGPVLIVRVRENPLIAEVTFEGLTLAQPEQFAAILARQHLLEPGRIYNTTEAARSITTLQQIYRQNGFPFDVPVTFTVAPADGDGPIETDTPVRLTYSVTETVPVTEVAFTGNTVLPAEELEAIFRPLAAGRVFDYLAYQEAVAEVNARYRAQGYRDSGVYPPATNLQDGLLNVGVRELTVGSIDTTAVGVDPAELSLRPGDLYNYDVLLADIRRLSEGRTTDISLSEPLILTGGQVRLSLLSGPPDTAGPIEEVVIEGNTVLPTEDLRAALALAPGETFTSALAAEDFARIAAAYAAAGYLIDAQPNFSYLDGTYVQRITELRIAAYRVIFENEAHRTQDFVVTRYLPPVGSVLNQNELRNALITLARQGVVEPLAFPLEPTGTPGEVIVNVTVRERPTGQFGPEATYDTNRGFAANLSFSDSNFLGRAHNISASLSAQTSDVGFLLGASVEYAIPWLYLDAYDFQQVPTSLSGSLFSVIETNQTLTQNGQVTVCYGGAATCPDDERVLVGEYTVRDSGLGFGVGRRIFPDTTFRIAARGSYRAYVLEPERPCEFDDGGDLINPGLCTLPEAEALPNLPQSGLSATVTTSVNFDNRDNPDFPRGGVAAGGSVGIGFGNDYRDPATNLQTRYSYLPVEFGVRTYVPLTAITPEIDNPNHIFAFKANVGHQFGGNYPIDRYFRVGQTLQDATLIRGYTRTDFNPSRTYAVGTVEYRYDFGLSTVATQTVIGIAFVDVGWASSVPGFADYGAPFFMGAGIGLQVNLGFTALGFFPLRFDYAFSQRNPGGVFSFRVGPVF